MKNSNHDDALGPPKVRCRGRDAAREARCLWAVWICLGTVKNTFKCPAGLGLEWEDAICPAVCWHTIKPRTISGSGHLTASQLMMSAFNTSTIAQNPVNVRADESNQSRQLRVRNAPLGFCNCQYLIYTECKLLRAGAVHSFFFLAAGRSPAAAVARTAWAACSAGI